MEAEVIILFLPFRTEFWSLVVVPHGNNPVTGKQMEGGHTRGVYVYCPGDKNSIAAPNTSHENSLALPVPRDFFVFATLTGILNLQKILKIFPHNIDLCCCYYEKKKNQDNRSKQVRPH